MFDSEVWYTIRVKRDKGMSIIDIASEMVMGIATVRKYLKAKRPMEYKRKNRISTLEPCKALLHERESIDIISQWPLFSSRSGGRNIE